LRQFPGWNRRKILQFGYAIEYDFVDPRALRRSLALKALPGLYLAGQINGTTGYEEAAAQGLVAGINAALRAANGADYTPFVLDRADAYIGVMIDDLITKGAPEPYRMFTSRAEYRLLLRADNADQRLTDRGLAIGCVGSVRETAWRAKSADLQAARSMLETSSQPAKAVAAAGLPSPRDGAARSAADLLTLESIGIAEILPLWPALEAISPRLHSQLEADYRYAGYVDRQQADIDALRRDEAVTIPAQIDFAAVGGLSAESKDILRRFQPETIGHANRLPGLTPAGGRCRASSYQAPAETGQSKSRIVTPDQVGELLNVSRETIEKFQAYLTLLEKWQRRINLVSNSTLAEAWQRHILDSGQLAAHYPPQDTAHS
jgi:tRNA uridine 5-carboxymethylaminomethyl modification enzyme